MDKHTDKANPEKCENDKTSTYACREHADGASSPPRGGSQLPNVVDLDVDVVVAEVYSPPRMCEMAEKLGMKG